MPYTSGVFEAYKATVDVHIGQEKGLIGAYVLQNEVVLFDGLVVKIVRTGEHFENPSFPKAITLGYFVLDPSFPIDGKVQILDEGLSLGYFKELDFQGVDIEARNSGLPNRAAISSPPAKVWKSHWNTADGGNGSQLVTETLTRTTARISTPFGGEGVPYRTNGWAGTDQEAAQDGAVTFTTPGLTTGWGGDSTMTVTLYLADGISIAQSYTTPPITGNGAYVSGTGHIVVTITGYGPDTPPRFEAKASVWVDVDAALTLLGYTGGRCHVEISHKTDSVTDLGVTYSYVESDVFMDYAPNPPAINGAVTLIETGGSVLTKHLSGLEYYVLGSQYTAQVVDIDYLNSNSQRVPSSLRLAASDYGLDTLDHSPFGAGSANFLGWTNDNNVMNVGYLITNWAITLPDYRYMGPTANAEATPRDPWVDGAAVATFNVPVLVDTYLSSSTDLFEGFDDEDRREDPATFLGAGTWNSAASLIAGEAMVFNSRLLVPNATTYIRSDGPNSPNANWSTFQPTIGGPNPNYNALGPPVDYGRRFTISGMGNLPSFQIVFTGTFAAGNALADLISGNLEIYVYRISGLGHVGPPPVNVWPLRVHVPFSFAAWDDGLTVPGSGIREASSSGNQIDCTFGTGTPAQLGFYCHVRILHIGTQIDSMTVTFT